MDYREYPASTALQPFIRCYWSLTGTEVDGFSDPEPALPDGCPELIFNCGAPMVAARGTGERTLQPHAILVGQITGPLTVAPTGRIQLVAVRFTPAGASLICDDLAELTDQWIDVSQLQPDVCATLQNVHTQLLAVTASSQHTPVQRAAYAVQILHSACEHLVTNRTGPDDTVQRAVHAILESHGMLSLDALAQQLHCSLRHLQRRFALQVGISPKQLARIRRFQRVFSAWRDDPNSLARVALECGYFDQSHLVRDFRELAGHAPAAFLSNQPEFTKLFLPHE